MDKKYLLIFLVAMIASCDQQPGSTGNPPKVSILDKQTRIEPSSVQIESAGPEGLFEAAQTGWHSQAPPRYPESLVFTFFENRHIAKIWLLPQDNHFDRAPKQFVIETSADGKNWESAQTIEGACKGPNDTWRSYKLEQGINTRYLRLKIVSNCGNPDILTLRGIRFE